MTKSCHSVARIAMCSEAIPASIELFDRGREIYAKLASGNHITVRGLPEHFAHCGRYVTRDLWRWKHERTPVPARLEHLGFFEYGVRLSNGAFGELKIASELPDGRHSRTGQERASGNHPHHLLSNLLVHGERKRRIDQQDHG